mmetsp:Transcript_14450/g.36516  ORF Transcript_14450/g.36516 Transcript_14450/m.36516 type:complete len:235 (+) Transcript_14450:1171-1875(+)
MQFLSDLCTRPRCSLQDSPVGDDASCLFCGRPLRGNNVDACWRGCLHDPPFACAAAGAWGGWSRRSGAGRSAAGWSGRHGLHGAGDGAASGYVLLCSPLHVVRDKPLSCPSAGTRCGHRLWPCLSCWRLHTNGLLGPGAVSGLVSWSSRHGLDRAIPRNNHLEPLCSRDWAAADLPEALALLRRPLAALLTASSEREIPPRWETGEAGRICCPKRWAHPGEEVPCCSVVYRSFW